MPKGHTLLSGKTTTDSFRERTDEVLRAVELQSLKVIRSVKGDHFQNINEERISELKKKVQEDEGIFKKTARKHFFFAFSVAFFSIAITFSGLSILVKTNLPIYLGLFTGGCGLISMSLGLFS